MQWNQIKTLFILCFLVLDVYLFVLFIDKQKEADIGIIENQEAPIEQQLEAENITKGTLPETPPDETFLTIKQKVFSDTELMMLESLTNQKIAVINGNFIISQFEKPIPIPEKATVEKITDVVRNVMLYPDEYEYWDWNTDYNVIVFFQKRNDRPIYFNQNGMILFYLNEENEITSYTQAMLGESLDASEDRREKKSIIKPIKVIEILYDGNRLYTGDEISRMNMGYHTMVPLANGEQVFVPTWKVAINGERNYFVNAIEGYIFSEDIEFVKQTIIAFKDKIRAMTDNKELKESMLEQLNQKLEAGNRSEEK